MRSPAIVPTRSLIIRLYIFHVMAVIEISLQTDKDKSRNRWETALNVWDRRREQEYGIHGEGSGTWDVAYWCEEAHSKDLEALLGCQVQVQDVVPTAGTLREVYTPGSDFVRNVYENKDCEDTFALFEWVGMACLGSQRYVSQSW